MKIHCHGYYGRWNNMATLYAPRIVTDGLVLCLDAGNRKSYPGSGTTWNDLSGANNTGTLTNGPTFSAANGGSISFDGVNDYIDVGNPTSLQLSSAITIHSWVKGTSFSTLGNIVSKNSNNGYRFRVNLNGSITWFDRGATNLIGTSAGVITTTTWYNIVTIGDSSGLKIYVNGTLNTSGGSAYSPTTSTGNFLIGANTEFNEYYNGNIATIIVFNRALTAAEVLQNYNATRSRFGI